MKKAATTSLIVLVLFLGSVAHSLNGAGGQTDGIDYVIKMSYTYSNKSDENRIWDFTEDDRTISLFMNSTWQTVQLTNSTFPIETIKNDTDGNLVAVLEFPDEHLSPGKNLTFSCTYSVVSKPRLLPQITEVWSGVLQNISADLREKYTGEEGPWLINNSTLQGLAHSIVGNETRVLTIVRKLVVWIHGNVHYPSTPHEVPLYANETYVSEDPLSNEGDCDDQAVLLITLSRILGIPAYLQIGAIYIPTINNELSTYWEGHVEELADKIGWHGWAMVYVPPWGWLPVDLTYAPGATADPLKAITNAAVTSQSTIQYMNIMESDYVASSRQARSFLIDNDFYVYTKDEMTQDLSPQDQFGEISGEWLVAGLIVITVILGASSFLAYRWLKKRRIEQENPKPSQWTQELRSRHARSKAHTP